MSILLILLLTLARALSPASPPPTAGAPSTQPTAAFEQALAGLRSLHEENLGLRARVQELEKERQMTMQIRAGDVLHVRADEIAPLGADAHLAELQWSFGDDDSDYNELGGFNAAHLYEREGTYTITLNGAPVRRVIVEKDARPARAVGDATQLAAALRAGGSVVRLPEGVIEVGETLQVAAGTLLVGNPAGSTLLWAGKPGGVMLEALAGQFTVRGVTFDSAATPFEKTACQAIVPGGTGIAVIGCTFLNVNDGINGNRRPKRVLMQDCRAPLPAGLRSYLAWVEGEQWVFLGNAAVNSTREHIVRCSASGPGAPGASFVLLAYNDFNNIDRREAAENPDKTDIAKSCLIFQAGEYGWAEHNLFRGISGVGPLSGPDGAREPERRFRHAVFRHNRHNDTLHLDDGAEHVLVAHCRFELPAGGGDGFASVQIEGFDGAFNRSVVDVTLRENVWTSPYRNACQLWVQGPVAQRLEITGNTFVGAPASYRWPTMPIVIEGGWQAEAYTSSDNELPPAAGGWPNKQAFARLGGQNDEGAYVTLQQWLSLPGAKGDRASVIAGPKPE